jgi:multicomponent Na+:H+ antiporter subunit E
LLRHLSLFVVLLGFWALLSGQLDYTDPGQRYLMICGVVSCALATLLARRVGFLYDEGHLGRILVRGIPYAAWLAWQVIASNIDVARRVWSLKPRKKINPQFVTISYTLHSDLATAIYANSITLTPGTVTVRVDTQKRILMVHALTDETAAGLQAMQDRVHKLEGEP